MNPKQMKKLSFLFILVVIPLMIKAQNPKWSIEANYVLPVGDNFLGENYNGIAEVGIKYRLLNLGIARIGGSLKASSYITNTDFGTVFGVTTQGIFLQPKLFVELAEVPFTKIHPFVEFGYDYALFRTTTDGIIQIEPVNTSRDGASIEAGIMYEIVERFYIQAMFDFTRLREDGTTTNNSFNRNISRIKAGIGIRI